MHNGDLLATTAASSFSAPARSHQNDNLVVRSIKRSGASAFCALAVLAALGCALGVAGIADMASSSKSRSAARRLGDARSSQQQDDVASPRSLATVCTFDEQWMSTKWAALSRQEQTAWTMLGWTQFVWDSSWAMAQKGVVTQTTTLPPTTTLFGQVPTTPIPTSFVPWTEHHRCWSDLSENERDAATSLGYSISRWGECKKRGCGWPGDTPVESASCLTKMLHLHTKFNESRAWFNMTQMKRDNLVLLGYDPDGNSWKAGRKPNSFGRPWSELTVREREAAHFLGYSHKLWESCEMVSDSPCLKRLEYLEINQRKWVWERLLAGTRERLTDMGWQTRTWFEGETPAIMKAPWMGLTNMQRSAARILGYSQDTFRGCPDATCLDRFAYVQKRWKGIGWMQMKLSERRAWMLLGHSEALWMANNLPSTMQKRWEELTPEQQLQATFLGHSEGTWQGCNTDWVGRVDNGTVGAIAVDPSGAVRGRMYIDRPYSEISGNVYGKQVSNMPTSFIRVFENSVARALFCGNPPLSLDPATYIGSDGEPICVQRTEFEKQKYRIRVLNVVEGSIVVDFFFVANATKEETTSRLLFEALVRQVEAKLTSPLCHDKYFTRFCTKATVNENKLSALKWNEMQAALQFEEKRKVYNQGNACVLHTDKKLGVTSCGSSAATSQHGTFFLQHFASTVLVLLALAVIPNA